MKSVSLVFLAALAMAYADESTLKMTKKSSFLSAAEDPLEIIVTKPSAKMVFASSSTGVTVLQLKDNLDLEELGFYDSMLSFGNPTSVAYCGIYDELAISVAAADPLTKGRVYIVDDVEKWVGCDLCEDYVSYKEAGYLPDMVTFTHDGQYILTADEGEPVDYTVPENDPEGSISIFKREDGYSKCTASFERFNAKYRTRRMMEKGVRKSGAEFTTFSQDMEPEFIAVDENNRWAYVTLQENNAVAKVEIEKCRVKRIFPLGYKEWGDDLLMDASDEDGEINLASYPMVKGMYQPDAIKAFKIDKTRYFVVANEGDAREYGEEDTPEFYTDETRVADLAEAANITITGTIYDENMLGRLKVTNSFPYEGGLDTLYAFGGRSISIFTNRGKFVWDSGDFMEKYTAENWAEIFNSEGGADSLDTRSDDKGIEPEGLALAKIEGRTFVFVALERIGGFMCWDISNPEEPVFQSYVNTNTEDTGPESAEVMPAENSPTGKPLLIGAYEASNTLAVFEIDV